MIIANNLRIYVMILKSWLRNKYQYWLSLYVQQYSDIYLYTYMHNYSFERINSHYLILIATLMFNVKNHVCNFTRYIL